MPLLNFGQNNKKYTSNRKTTYMSFIFVVWANHQSPGNLGECNAHMVAYAYKLRAKYHFIRKNQTLMVIHCRSIRKLVFGWKFWTQRMVKCQSGSWSPEKSFETRVMIPPGFYRCYTNILVDSWNETLGRRYNKNILSKKRKQSINKHYLLGTEFRSTGEYQKLSRVEHTK